MPSSADPVSAALGIALDELVDRVARSTDVAPVVIIDGRSGSGKTTLANALRARWPLPAGADVLSLDSIYPGWDGLRAGSEYLESHVLTPRREGRRATWRRWDWSADRRAEAHDVDPDRGLIVEGAGALTGRTAPGSSVRVWIESPADSRRDRAIRRDGDAYRPHWERWARQEDAHVDAERPRDLASVVIDVP